MHTVTEGECYVQVREFEIGDATAPEPRDDRE